MEMAAVNIIQGGLPWAMLGAALAAGLAGIGSSIGVGLAGKAAAGVLSEDPTKFGTLLLLVALPGTQGVYGFVVGFIVMLKLGFIGGSILAITTAQGLQILAACLPVGILGLMSAIHQGKVCTAGVGAAAKRKETAMNSLVFGVLVETYAVFGFLVSFLMLNALKLS